MPRTERARRRPARVTAGATLLVLGWALLLGACDGGIFGTGDGTGGGGGPSPVDAGTGGSPPGLAPENGSDGGDNPVAPDPGTPGSGTSGAPPDSPSPGTPSPPGSVSPGTPPSPPTVGPRAEAPSEPFVNTLVGGTVESPRVRLLNASGGSVRLWEGDGTALAPTSGVASGTVGDYVALGLGTEALIVSRMLAPPGSTLQEADVLYRIEPLELGAASVSELLVRDSAAPAGSDRGVDVVPLETLTVTDDAAQALVRVVLGARLVDPDDDAPPASRLTLAPAGTAPGGAEVAFEPLSFEAAPASAYARVPAGDYRLTEAAGQVTPRELSFAGGGVYTLVATGPGTVLRVIDGEPSGR